MIQLNVNGVAACQNVSTKQIYPHNARYIFITGEFIAKNIYLRQKNTDLEMRNMLCNIN